MLNQYCTSVFLFTALVTQVTHYTSSLILKKRCNKQQLCSVLVAVRRERSSRDEIRASDKTDDEAHTRTSSHPHYIHGVRFRFMLRTLLCPA